MFLKSNDPLSNKAKALGLETWPALCDYIRDLPYGRTANRADLSLVLTEKQGTCSSKHAVLKEIADKNQLPNIELILCLFKMTEKNTPGIGTHLSQNKLTYIPEAHCYLKVNGQRQDYTKPSASLAEIADDILEEQPITPAQVNEYKVNYHQAYLKKWLVESELNFDFEAIWVIRERCIESLKTV